MGAPSRTQLLTGNKDVNSSTWNNQGASNNLQGNVNRLVAATESSQKTNLMYLAGSTERLTDFQVRKIKLDEDVTKQNAIVKAKEAQLPAFNTERRAGSNAEMKAITEYGEANSQLRKNQKIQPHVNREVGEALKSVNKEQNASVQNTTRLAEATALMEKGDYQGAEKVLNGQSHQTQENVTIKLDIKDNQANTERSNLDPKHASALGYQEGLTQLALNGQVEIKDMQQQAEFLRKAAMENPRLSAVQKQEFLKQETNLQAQILERARQLDQIQQVQPHVTDLIDQGKYEEINKLQNEENRFPTIAKYNDKELAQQVLKIEPKLTIEQTKKDIKRLQDLSSQAKESLDKYSDRYSKDSSDTSSDSRKIKDDSWNYFDRALISKLDNLADVEGTQGTKLHTVSTSLTKANNDAKKLIEDGKLPEARDLLRSSLKSFAREIADSKNVISKERSNEKLLAPINQEIDASHKAIRNGLVMAGATIVTGGLAGAAIKTSGTALSFAQAASYTAAGTGAAVGAAALGEFSGTMMAGGSAGEALKYSASQLLENSKSAALGSLGAVVGANWGPKIAAQLLSPQANQSLQLVIKSSTAGLTGAVPGVINDVAGQAAERVALISTLQKEGKSQAEIDKVLQERKLDFQSMASSTGINLASGAASGLIGGLGNNKVQSIVKEAQKAGTSSLRTGLMKVPTKIAEEVTGLAIAAAETAAQGYVPGTPEFNNAMIANFASLAPSKMAGALSSRINTTATKSKVDGDDSGSAKSTPNEVDIDVQGKPGEALTIKSPGDKTYVDTLSPQIELEKKISNLVDRLNKVLKPQIEYSSPSDRLYEDKLGRAARTKEDNRRLKQTQQDSDALFKELKNLSPEEQLLVYNRANQNPEAERWAYTPLNSQWEPLKTKIKERLQQTTAEAKAGLNNHQQNRLAALDFQTQAIKIIKHDLEINNKRELIKGALEDIKAYKARTMTESEFLAKYKDLVASEKSHEQQRIGVTYNMNQLEQFNSTHTIIDRLNTRLSSELQSLTAYPRRPLISEGMTIDISGEAGNDVLKQLVEGSYMDLANNLPNLVNPAPSRLTVDPNTQIILEAD